MKPFKQKYYLLFSLLLLSAYLMGNFGMVVFETIHFLSHLGDSTNHHTLEIHDDSHNHQTLTILLDLTNSDNSSEVPVSNDSNKKTKKLIQNIPTKVVFLDPILFLKSTIQYSNYQLLKNQFSRQLPLPPPKFS